MRVRYLSYIFILLALLTVIKLFTIQIVHHEKYIVEADNQHVASYKIPAVRGTILTSDGYALVANKKAFLVYLSLKELRDSNHFSPEYVTETAGKLAKAFWDYDHRILIHKEEPPKDLSDSDRAAFEAAVESRKKDAIQKQTAEIISGVSNQKLVWVPLKRRVDDSAKEELTRLQIPGLGFQEISVRSYPEASLSAQTLGFVGLDTADNPQGYEGLEGHYDRDLKGRSGFLKQEIDADGRPILVGESFNAPVIQGATLKTTINRAVQYIAQQKLDEGVKKFGAKGGSVLIMDPLTGAIIASASNPGFNPDFWDQYKKEELTDPAIAATYEPGSTFKLVTYSAGIDTGVITPETVCDCSGPITLNGFKISTWNGKYNPNSTMVEGLQNSDNIVTSFIANKLGTEQLFRYIQAFGFGELTDIDLQGEEKGIINDPKGWHDIDLATASFGQGLTVTPIQMIRAVGAIANGGQLVKPFVVGTIETKIGTETRQNPTSPKMVRQVIKPTTAAQMKEMMVRAVENGESKNFLPKGMKVAGKTGTAQIPVEGKYDPNNYTASFVGFAPVEQPKFLMLVKYDKPSASIYGSTTAAPTFFEIAKELYTYWGIPLGE